MRKSRTRVQRVRAAEANELLRALFDDMQGASRPMRRLVVKSDGKVTFLKPEDVDWIEAAGNYVRLHMGARVPLLRETSVNALDARLPPGQFVRIRRSIIVNVERIRALEPTFHGDYVVLLRDGTEFILSRSYRPKVEEFLGRPL